MMHGEELDSSRDGGGKMSLLRVGKGGICARESDIIPTLLPAVKNFHLQVSIIFTTNVFFSWP
jgi:hypothetical protein